MTHQHPRRGRHLHGHCNVSNQPLKSCLAAQSCSCIQAKACRRTHSSQHYSIGGKDRSQPPVLGSGDVKSEQEIAYSKLVCSISLQAKIRAGQQAVKKRRAPWRKKRSFS